MNKKKSGLNIFATLRDIAHGYWERWMDLAQLARLETQLAIKTIIKISIIIYLLGFMLTTTWITLLVILFLSLLNLHWSALGASVLILFINLILIALLVSYILCIKKYAFFNATRRQLTHHPE